MTAFDRKRILSTRYVVALSCLTLLLMTIGCASPAGQATGPAGPAAPKPLKVLTIGSQRGVGSFSPFGGSLGGAFATGFVHDLLTRETNPAVFEGRLAEQISIEKGTWRRNPDGTMDVTWKLQPNVRWHDDAPFTSNDLVFSFNVYKDRDMGASFAGLMRAMESVSAPDTLTFQIHYSTLDAKARPGQRQVPDRRHRRPPARAALRVRVAEDLNSAQPCRASLTRRERHGPTPKPRGRPHLS